MTSNKKSKDDAIASFSWYLYQAEVSFLVALEKIKAIIDAGKESELENWTLHIEWEEDIVLSEEGSAEKHLYQVKDTSDADPEDYTIAFLKLFQKWKSDSKDRYYLVTSQNLFPTGSYTPEEYANFLGGLFTKKWVTTNQETLRYIYSLEWAKCCIRESNDKKLTFALDNTSVGNLFGAHTFSFWTSNFSYRHTAGHDNVRKDIVTLIKELKPDSDHTEYEGHYHYRTSQIKQWIQSQKGIEVEKRTGIPLEEVYNQIKSSEILMLTESDYRTFFRNEFIRKFREIIAKFRVPWRITPDPCIPEDKREQCLFSVEALVGEIFNLVDWDGFERFIDLTIGMPWKDNCRNFSWVTKVLSDAGFKDKLIPKIKLLSRYIYSISHPECTDGLKARYYHTDGSAIQQWWSKGFMTWISLVGWTDDLQVFLEKDLLTHYESDYLWVFDSPDKTIDAYLKNQSAGSTEPQFFDDNKDDADWYYQGRKSKHVKLFWWQNCHADNYQSFIG